MVWAKEVMKHTHTKQKKNETNNRSRNKTRAIIQFNKTISMKSQNNSNTFFNGFIMVFLKTIYTYGMIINILQKKTNKHDDKERKSHNITNKTNFFRLY